MHGPVDGETIAGRALDLGEDSVPHILGGDEQRGDKDGGHADDDDGREAPQRETQLSLQGQEYKWLTTLPLISLRTGNHPPSRCC